MNTRRFAIVAVVAILAAACFGLANAQASVTYSGNALSSLTYVGNSGDAQYVAGTPDVAQLYTANSGTAEADDSPAVFVYGLGPLGTLNNFYASYSLTSFSGPNGTEPYWNINVSPVGHPTDAVNIISMGGTPLNGSSAVHAYNSDYSASVGTWGMALSGLGALTYDGYTIGDMTVNWAGVEIGDWDNGDLTISASANFDSITVGSVPEPATLIVWSLLGAASWLGIRVVRRKRTA
jgi:hypothetical protein